MLSISKIAGIASCGFALFVGLSDANAARSEDLVKGETISGEVVRVEGDHLLVKEKDGIVATVDEQNHALSIQSSDRRSDHTLESGQAVEPR
jgi:hypothetical protein